MSEDIPSSMLNLHTKYSQITAVLQNIRSLNTMNYIM